MQLVKKLGKLGIHRAPSMLNLLNRLKPLVPSMSQKRLLAVEDLNVSDEDMRESDPKQSDDTLPQYCYSL
jgi:hypothetical protein